MKRLVRFLTEGGCSVQSKAGGNLVIDGERAVVIRSEAAFGSVWQYPGYSVELPILAPLPARFLVLSKDAVAVFIFEGAASRCWMKGKQKFAAPLVTGDFFRIDGGAPPPYTMDLLMRERRLAPRRLMGSEVRYLKERASLGSFRQLADKLREAATKEPP